MTRDTLHLSSGKATTLMHINALQRKYERPGALLVQGTVSTKICVAGPRPRRLSKF